MKRNVLDNGQVSCYGEIGRHTGLRGLRPSKGHLGSNPSSNNFEW